MNRKWVVTIHLTEMQKIQVSSQQTSLWRGMTIMKNLAVTDEILTGKVYMVEMQDGEISSFRVMNETPTHYILSYTTSETVEVFEKAKNEIIGIFEVREWWDIKGKMADH
jgi:hypothetical protein